MPNTRENKSSDAPMKKKLGRRRKRLRILRRQEWRY